MDDATSYSSDSIFRVHYSMDIHFYSVVEKESWNIIDPLGVTGISSWEYYCISLPLCSMYYWSY